MLMAVLTGLTLAASTAAPASADSTRDQQWSLSFLNATEPSRISHGEGIVVAVIDTGVDASHPDLAGTVLKGIDKSRPTRRPHRRPHRPRHPRPRTKAKILPVRVGPRTGAGHPDELAEGILRAAEAGAKVICVASSGGSTNALKSSIAYAYQQGAVVVAGIGNTTDFADIGYPAAYRSVVAVAGVKKDGTISDISAQGDTAGEVT